MSTFGSLLDLATWSLGNSHFAAIDVATMTAVTSLIVQGYFCYRIWIINRRFSWICWIIAVVCIPDPPRILQVHDVFPEFRLR